MTNKLMDVSTLQDSLRRLQWHLWHLWRLEAQKSGSMELTSVEHDYLDVVARNPDGLRLTDLAERMGVSKASASASLFRNGRNQALRLPREMEFIWYWQPNALA